MRLLMQRNHDRIMAARIEGLSAVERVLSQQKPQLIARRACQVRLRPQRASSVLAAVPQIINHGTRLYASITTRRHACL